MAARVCERCGAWLMFKAGIAYVYRDAYRPVLDAFKEVA